MHSYLHVLKNYTTFDGRAGRKELWMFMLVHLFFTAITIAADRLLGACFHYDTGYGEKILPFGYVFFIYTLATLLPAVAVQVRRLHDTGKSGWWFFAVLIPAIGALYLLVLYCTAGRPGNNSYGPGAV